MAGHALGEAVSSPPRVLVPGGRIAAGVAVPLPDAEARHLRVSRAGAGGTVVLLDGTGGRAEAILSASGKEAVVTRLVPPKGEPARRVTLLLGVGEPARVEWAVEKGTECGASLFLLVSAARSQKAHVAAAAARLERIRRIAAEAVKQCDRTVVPAIVGPLPLDAALEACDRALLVARPGAPELQPGLVPAGSVSVAIGPEGGFDPVEEALLDASGALPVGLGNRILRLETAVVATLSRLAVDEGVA
jgi:16S rRNA (uracil1498-N3)-methyltransferase